MISGAHPDLNPTTGYSGDAFDRKDKKNITMLLLRVRRNISHCKALITDPLFKQYQCREMTERTRGLLQGALSDRVLEMDRKPRPKNNLARGYDTQHHANGYDSLSTARTKHESSHRNPNTSLPRGRKEKSHFRVGFGTSTDYSESSE